MALVNPNIALGVKSVELQDPMAQYAKIAAIQGAQQQNQLARMQMAEYERTRGEEDQLRNYLAQSDFSKPEARAGLTKFGKTGLAYSKALTEQDTAKLAQQKANVELLDAKLKQSRGFLDTLDPADPTAPARYLAWHEANHKDPIIGAALNARGVSAEQARQSIEAAIAKGPEAFAQMLNQSKLGTEKFMEMNKPTLTPQNLGGTVQILQTPGLGGQATVVPGSTGAVTQTPAQIEQAKRDQQRLGLEAQRVGLEGQRVELARQDSERKTQGLDVLPPKEVQKREAAFPQATSVIKGFETKSDSFVKDLQKLRDHPGLSQITGLIAGRVPALTADGRAAQALYDKVVAKGGFQALQDLRDASKTGGALGNVSNQEGKQLTASFAAIDRRQDAKDVQAAIDDAIGSVQGAKTRMREAYDSTYSYKAGSTPAADPLGIR